MGLPSHFGQRTSVWAYLWTQGILRGFGASGVLGATRISQIWGPQVLGEHSGTIWGESGFYGLKIWEKLYAGRVRYWQLLTD